MPGVLYARVGGAWVPIGTGGNTYPAYAGERRDGATSVAAFGHVDLGGKNGFTAFNDGTLSLNHKVGGVTQFVEIAANGTTEQWVATVKKDSFQVSDLVMGLHPAVGLNAMWLASRPAAADYIWAREGGGLLLNAYALSRISFRAGNTEWAHLDTSAANHEWHTTTRNISNFTNPTYDYYWANFMALLPGGPQNPRISLVATSTGAQLRADVTTGQKLGVVTLNISGFAPIAASAFEVGSSLAYKRDVRHLDRQQDRIVVRHDPMSDTVPEVDIMDLRPVRFRPKVGEIKIVLDPEFPDDHTKGHYEPADGILGHEGSRERLGMVAEEVQHIVPSAVTHDSNGNCTGIDYAQITVALLDHVQRLTEEVATLRYRITELEGTA